eukprot:CAMPEP_0117624802 /NCGR_PEP_ID=MMETSP0802-20121206/570_1 /TAXON_ID=38833 /ORGANISM="Micromonas sp., Strain CCMP2099" /LENGTH=140 /DNA_ID=CAMNT_0005428857 /DNA_START=23 /DNA_END=444 /DNA_ORIENTATION=+
MTSIYTSVSVLVSTSTSSISRPGARPDQKLPSVIPVVLLSPSIHPLELPSIPVTVSFGHVNPALNSPVKHSPSSSVPSDHVEASDGGYREPLAYGGYLVVAFQIHETQGEETYQRRDLRADANTFQSQRFTGGTPRVRVA